MTMRPGSPRRRRTHDEPSDTGSLPLAMMLTLVGVTLSTLIIPIVIGQVHDTTTTVDRSRGLHAAQAGIDLALAQLRASTGDITNLLCLPATDPLYGSVDAGTPGQRCPHCRAASSNRESRSTAEATAGFSRV